MYESVAGNVAVRYVEKEISRNYGHSALARKQHKAAHEVSSKFIYKKKPGRFTSRLKSACPTLQAPRVTEWTKDQHTVLAELIEGVEGAFPDIENPGQALFNEVGMGLYRYYFGDGGTSRYANPSYMSQHAIKRCLHRDAFSADEMKEEIARCLHLAACVAEHVPEDAIFEGNHVSALIPYRDGALCALILPDSHHTHDRHFGPETRKLSCVIRTYLSPCMIHDGGARRLGLLDCILEESVTASRSMVLNADLVSRVGRNLQNWNYTPTPTLKAPAKQSKAMEVEYA